MRYNGNNWFCTREAMDWRVGTMVDQPERRFSPEHRAQLILALEDRAKEQGLEVHPSFSEALLNYSEFVGVRELSNAELCLALGVIGALTIEGQMQTGAP